jgi:glycosyl hydrolase family 2
MTAGMRAIVTGVAILLSLLTCGGRVLGQAPVAICSDWLMQDAARVKETGEVISRVGFAPPVYVAGAYAAPATAIANRPTSTVISPAVRYFVAGGGGGGRGGGGGGGTQWPVEPEKNRPTYSSQWAQAPGPASPAWYRATVPGTVLTTLVNNNVYPEPLFGENNRPNIIPESLSRASYWFRSEFLVPAGFAGRQIRLNFDGINYSAEVWMNGSKVGTIQGAFIRAEFNVTALVTPGGAAAVAVLIRPPPHPGDPWEKTVANQRGPNGGGSAGPLGEISFRSAPIVLPPGESRLVKFNPQNTAQLRLSNPKLWWPNGFGDPYLYPLHLRFDIDGVSSDATDFKVGIRKVAYFVDGSKNLTLSVNGVRVFAKGGNWGMDEAMKRIPRRRLEAQIKMHQLAHYDIIRNWAGQSTSEDFYDLCDQYGIMVWDEFFEANPANGLNPLDADLYLSNVRDKVLRYRNHPCIVVWCGRNEGAPPPKIEAGNARIIGELDPSRYYQSSSTAGNGVVSGGGGYGWRVPRRFYGIYPAFNTEVGSASIPTLEAIESWMPQTDWFDKNFPNDDWAEHDLVTGNGSPAANPFHLAIARRFGSFATLADCAQVADGRL